jgi:hypothetical protein
MKIKDEDFSDLVEWVARSQAISVRMVKAILESKKQKIKDSEVLDRMVEAVKLRTIQCLEEKVDYKV